MEKIPGEALVVRGGRNRPEDIKRATGIHPSGITGISVECAVGLSVAQLAVCIPHGLVGVTTVNEIRSLGGDVIRTSGRSPNHATLTGLTPEQINSLLMPTIANPARQNSSS
ncbi:MAG: flavoredoxin [Nostoc sp. CreGUA01]|nr:flavoredoxin [Nostoc sp. CreGUA01]